MKDMVGDRIFITKLFVLALPIVSQNFFETLMYLVNNIIIAKLGDSSIAAVGIATQVMFILLVFMFGINSGAAMFVAQFYGAGDFKSIRKISCITLFAGNIFGIMFTIAFITMPRFIMSLFTKDLEVIDIGSAYLSYSAIGILPIAFTFAIIFCLRGVGSVRRVSIILGISTAIGVSLAYILIFGRFGLKPMGVRGAALGLGLSRWLELLALVVLILTKRDLIPNIGDLRDISAAFLSNFIKKTVPVILNEIMWVLGITAFAVVYARLGTDICAAANVFLSIEKLGVVVFWGLAQACAIIVGNHIGAGDTSKAYKDGGRILLLSFLLAFIISGLLFLFRNQILGLFDISQSARDSALVILNIFILLLPIKAVNVINLVGVLRSGGDTKFAFIMEFIVLWLLAVPATYYTAFFLGASLGLIYLAETSEEVLKFLIGLKRYSSKKWMNDLTRCSC